MIFCKVLNGQEDRRCNCRMEEKQFLNGREYCPEILIFFSWKMFRDSVTK